MKARVVCSRPVDSPNGDVEQRQLPDDEVAGREVPFEHRAGVVEVEPEMARVDAEERDPPPPVVAHGPEHRAVAADDQDAVGVLRVLEFLEPPRPLARLGVAFVEDQLQPGLFSHRPVRGAAGDAAPVDAVAFDVGPNLGGDEVLVGFPLEDFLADGRARSPASRQGDQLALRRHVVRLGGVSLARDHRETQPIAKARRPRPRAAGPRIDHPCLRRSDRSLPRARCHRPARSGHPARRGKSKPPVPSRGGRPPRAAGRERRCRSARRGKPSPPRSRRVRRAALRWAPR